MKKTFHISVAAFAFILTLNSCGGNNGNQQTDSTANTAAVSTVAEKETAANNITLEANDEMQFSKVEIRVTAGQPITLTLKHTGKMTKLVMGHDFVLLKQGTDIDAFGHAAMSAQSEDYIPASESKNILAHTKLLGGGESDTIEFTVTEKGTYDYICSFPGHYAIMKGKLIAE